MSREGAIDFVGKPRAAHAATGRCQREPHFGGGRETRGTLGERCGSLLGDSSPLFQPLGHIAAQDDGPRIANGRSGPFPGFGLGVVAVDGNNAAGRFAAVECVATGPALGLNGRFADRSPAPFGTGPKLDLGGEFDLRGRFVRVLPEQFEADLFGGIPPAAHFVASGDRRELGGRFVGWEVADNLREIRDQLVGGAVVAAAGLPEGAHQERIDCFAIAGGTLSPGSKFAVDRVPRAAGGTVGRDAESAEEVGRCVALTIRPLGPAEGEREPARAGERTVAQTAASDSSDERVARRTQMRQVAGGVERHAAAAGGHVFARHQEEAGDGPGGKLQLVGQFEVTCRIGRFVAGLGDRLVDKGGDSVSGQRGAGDDDGRSPGAQLANERGDELAAPGAFGRFVPGGDQLGGVAVEVGTVDGQPGRRVEPPCPDGGNECLGRRVARRLAIGGDDGHLGSKPLFAGIVGQRGPGNLALASSDDERGGTSLAPSYNVPRLARVGRSQNLSPRAHGVPRARGCHLQRGERGGDGCADRFPRGSGIDAAADNAAGHPRSEDDPFVGPDGVKVDRASYRGRQRRRSRPRDARVLSLEQCSRVPHQPARAAPQQLNRVQAAIGEAVEPGGLRLEPEDQPGIAQAIGDDALIEIDERPGLPTDRRHGRDGEPGVAPVFGAEQGRSRPEAAFPGRVAPDESLLRREEPSTGQAGQPLALGGSGLVGPGGAAVAADEDDAARLARPGGPLAAHDDEELVGGGDDGAERGGGAGFDWSPVFARIFGF